jgi:hypothetical protein
MTRAPRGAAMTKLPCNIYATDEVVRDALQYLSLCGGEVESITRQPFGGYRINFWHADFGGDLALQFTRGPGTFGAALIPAQVGRNPSGPRREAGSVRKHEHAVPEGDAPNLHHQNTPTNSSHIYAPDGAIIAQVHNPGSKESDYPLVANRDLMAAAPEMLEALLEAEKHFGEFASITINGQHDPDDIRVVGMFRAAIAKARGETVIA